MSTEVPPYDVYIFIGVILLCMIAYTAVCGCIFYRRRKALLDQDSKAAPMSGAPHTYGGNELLAMPEEGRVMPPPTASQSEPPSCCSTAKPFLLFHVPVGLLSMAVLAFALTCAIMAILGSTSMLDSLLFSPELASSCGAPCSFYSQAGLNGWVDEKCCSYNPVSLSFSDVYLQFANDGKYIHGWLMINSTKASPGQGYVAMLYNHGSGGNVASGYRVARYQYYLSQGNIAIFIFDYPGYGKSSGSAGADSVSAASLIAAEWFETWFGNGSWSLSTTPLGSASAPVVMPPMDPSSLAMNNITILGRSMGGAMATYVGSRTNWSSHSLLLQSTFSSVSDLCLAYFPMFGWIWAAQAKKRFPQFDNTENIAPTTSCLYHSHSKTDEWVPFSESEKIESAASRKDASCSTYVVVPEALHTQPLTDQERSALASWLLQVRKAY